MLLPEGSPPVDTAVSTEIGARVETTVPDPAYALSPENSERPYERNMVRQESVGLSIVSFHPASFGMRETRAIAGDTRERHDRFFAPTAVKSQ